MTVSEYKAQGAYDTLTRVLAGELSAVVWATDDQLRITSCLGPALNLRGLSPDRAMGKTIMDFFSLDATDAPLLAAHQHALLGQPISCELAWQETSYHAFVAPQRDEVGRVVGCTGFAREKTPVDREAEELYRLFNLSLHMLCIAGTDGYFKRVNPAFEKTLGYKPDELLKRPFIDFVHPEDRETTRQELDKLSRGQSTLYFENRYRCNDGSYRWLSWTSMPKSEDGMVYATALDITERKRAESLFRALLESAPDGVVVVDGGGSIVLLNRMAECVFGYERDELIGQPVEMLIPEEFRERHQANRDRFLAQPEFTTMGGGGCVCARRKDGTEFPVEVRLSPVEIEGARVVFAAVRDVSEREQMQRSLREKQCELIAAQRIQQHLLPQSAPSIPGLEVAGIVSPATYAGGDHYDFIQMDDGRLGVIIGDVAGHGFSSALVMASTHELLRAGAMLHHDIGAVLNHTNRALIQEVECGIFVTVLFACIEMPARRVTFANAGHPPGIILDSTGQVREYLEGTSPPLIVLPDTDFEVRGPRQLHAGDTLLMITDGVLEAQLPDGEQFGLKRLIDTVRPLLDRSAREIVATLSATVRSVSADAELQDDVTAVVVKVA
jgi:PAS domain S-box-containing protein